MSIIDQRILKREIKHFRLTVKEDERWRKEVKNEENFASCHSQKSERISSAAYRRERRAQPLGVEYIYWGDRRSATVKQAL